LTTHGYVENLSLWILPALQRLFKKSNRPSIFILQDIMAPANVFQSLLEWRSRTKGSLRDSRLRFIRKPCSFVETKIQEIIQPVLIA